MSISFPPTYMHISPLTHHAFRQHNTHMDNNGRTPHSRVQQLTFFHADFRKEFHFSRRFSRKGTCTNPRGMFPTKTLGEFCRGFFCGFGGGGLFSLGKTGRKNPPKNPQQNSNQNLGVSRRKSTLQGSGLDRFQEGISFPNFAERPTLTLPLSKLCDVHFDLQNRALFEGKTRAKRCQEKGRDWGGQQRGQKGKKGV